MTDLAPIPKFRQALAEAKTIEEVKTIRDTGHSAIQHAKRLGTATRQQIAEAMALVLEAERRAGAMLAGMKFDKGGRPTETPSAMKGVSLGSLGITWTQSHRWQAVATIPEDAFREWLEAELAVNRVPTSSGLYQFARSLSTTSEQDAAPDGCVVTEDLHALVADGQKFNCIYADPPWAYSNAATRASVVPQPSSNGSHGRKSAYKAVMTIEAICEEPVAALAAEESHLYLWTTTSFLPDAFRVIDAWGFTYKTNMVWVKPQMGIGNYVRVSHEHLLIGVRGGLRTNGKSQKSWLEEPRTKHSRKPAAFRRVVETMSRGPYLELYGREPIEGWTVYGNEVETGLFDG